MTDPVPCLTTHEVAVIPLTSWLTSLHLGAAVVRTIDAGLIALARPPPLLAVTRECPRFFNHLFAPRWLLGYEDVFSAHEVLCEIEPRLSARP
jgi:hypothetical protein